MIRICNHEVGKCTQNVHFQLSQPLSLLHRTKFDQMYGCIIDIQSFNFYKEHIFKIM